MNSYKKTIIAIHIAVWLMIFLSPLTFLDRDDKFEIDKLIPMFSCPIVMMVVFYTTYLNLTPHYLLRGKKREFWIYTVALVVVAAIVLHLWLSVSNRIFFHPELKPHRHHIHPPILPMDVIFIVRNMFNMAVTAAIATMSILSIKWHSSEAARREAEMARQEAELKNLRNQVNPHFLLNTLNNIYALTAFDQAKAQQAILELSGMLRHILYDNQQNFVRLKDEIAFIHSYINLMKMRIAGNTDISFEVDVEDENADNIRVAPLIFISLIENAFKHGTSASGKSFIHIVLAADSNIIKCEIRNSNCPKNEADRSGHGIGLEQVEKRLKLAYPGQYEWEKGTTENEKEYYSKITIYDTKLRNN